MCNLNAQEVLELDYDSGWIIFSLDFDFFSLHADTPWVISLIISGFFCWLGLYSGSKDETVRQNGPTTVSFSRSCWTDRSMDWNGFDLTIPDYLLAKFSFVSLDVHIQNHLRILKLTDSTDFYFGWQVVVRLLDPDFGWFDVHGVAPPAPPSIEQENYKIWVFSTKPI